MRATIQSPTDRGQTTVLMAVVVMLLLGLAFGIVVVGRAAVDRARARTGADAIALAAAGDPTAAAELGHWYTTTSGADVAVDGDSVWVGVGDSQAAAWASSARGEVRVAPAVVAIIARAGQLLGHEFVPVEIRGRSVWFSAVEAPLFDAVARELGMCPAVQSGAGRGYVLC